MIPESLVFDQQTMIRLLEHDPVVQRYRLFFDQLDCSVVPDLPVGRSRPGRRPHPQRAYIKALRIRVCQGFEYISQLRRFLVEHPLFVLDIGFRPDLNWLNPYGFNVEPTVPTAHRLGDYQRNLDHRVLQDLLHATVWALQEEIPGLGGTVAFDVKHIYAWVREKNPRESIGFRFSPERQPKGDPDCRVGVKKCPNREQADGEIKGEERVSLGIWQWSCNSNHCRLWRCGARR